MKIRETVTAPAAVLATYGLYYLCYLSPVVQNALRAYSDYSLISGVVLEVLVLLMPAVIYAKIKGVGYSVKMHFAAFHPSCIVFCLLAVVFALAALSLCATFTNYFGITGGKYSLGDTYMLSVSDKELPTGLRLLTYTVLPCMAEEFLYRGVLITELRENGAASAVIFSSVLFAFGQFSFDKLPAYILLGLIMSGVFYVTNSLPMTVIVRVCIGIAVFYFEDAAWSLILKRSDIVFFTCLCAVLMLLCAALALSEAQRIFYNRALDALPSPPESTLAAGLPASLLTALLSPTFILCAAAYICVMLLVR